MKNKILNIILLRLLNKVLLLSFLCGLPILVFAYQYPVKKIRITSLFGESRGDHFHTGMDFAIPQPIYPIEQGELLFYLDKNVHPYSYKFGIGNMAVVEHFDKLRSYYYHLLDNSIDKSLEEVTIYNQIGLMGDTGKSFGSHLHLVLVDFSEDKFLNPSLIFPFESDKVKPKISSFFSIINGEVFKFGKNSNLKYFGPMQLFTIAGDMNYGYTKNSPLNNLTAFGLKKLIFEVDDKKVKEFDFTAIYIGESGELVTESGNTFKETYGLAFNYKLGQFIPVEKSHDFKVVVEDWNNNTATSKYVINFK